MEKLIIISVSCSIIGYAALSLLLVKSCSMIKETGLKSVIQEIWEGKNSISK